VYKIKVIENEKNRKNKKVIEGSSFSLKGNTIYTFSFSALYASRILFYFSEGGIARINIYAENDTTNNTTNNNTTNNNTTNNTTNNTNNNEEDLLEGSEILAVTDASYGDPSLVKRKKREGKEMKGWETCRHSYRQRLGFKLKNKIKKISKIEIDTYMHSLNAFKYFILLGREENEEKENEDEILINDLPKWKFKLGNDKKIIMEDKDINNNIINYEKEELNVKYNLDLKNYNGKWKVVIPWKKLERDTLHEYYEKDIVINNNLQNGISYLLLIAVPDGGIHRIGISGQTFS